MSNEMAIYEEKPLTAQDVRAQVNLIQEVMRAVMIDGQHYGKIPGAGDKPTLLKPGAEKIMATFRLSVDPEVEDLSFEDIIRYRVKCKLFSPSGRMVGAGIGECSTEEEKYKWRWAVAEAEFNATPETHKRMKYKRDGGTIKQVRTNPFDIANTVLKMAKKRALVDAVLTTTAASDIFEQDIEDLSDDIITMNAKQTITPPKEKQQKSATAAKTTTAPALLTMKELAEKIKTSVNVFELEARAKKYRPDFDAMTADEQQYIKDIKGIRHDEIKAAVHDQEMEAI